VPLQESGNGEGPLPQDPRYRFLDRGDSLFDIRHRFTQRALYELPIGQGRRYGFQQRWMKTLLGDWQVNLILSTQTGLPFAPVLANSVANTGTSSRPNLVADWYIPNPTITHWFNTALNTPGAPWVTPAQATYGNAGRGTRAEVFCELPAAPTWIFRCLSSLQSPKDSACNSGGNSSTS
jgi:hypothetical protein